ncbi:hypothetical protein P3T73_03965 [Kiritimatiellota bacterium B12222]|nr:hypothetical protein P3T73_03965 [Kiritimatiellota bacterium B12222]
MKICILLCITVGLSGLWSPVMGRDPFWPIGYNGKTPEVVVEEPVYVPEVVRELTDAELVELARKEAEKIREKLVRKGTMKANGKIYAYVQNKWYTIGDTIEVTALGNTYRLEIKTLTSDNIELEAHRTVTPTQN